MASEAAISRILSDLSRSRLARESPGCASEDLVQQALMDVLARYPDLPEDELARLAFVRLRQLLLEQRRNQSTRDRLLRQHSDELASRASPLADPREIAAEEELRTEMRRALVEALTPEQRTLLWRHFQGGESVAAIADSLGVSRATAARRMAEAVSLLGKATKLAKGE